MRVLKGERGSLSLCKSRFFLIARERSGEQLREVFKVLGSTGNVCAFLWR